MYVRIYVYIYVYLYIYIYTYIYDSVYIYHNRFPTFFPVSTINLSWLSTISGARARLKACLCLCHGARKWRRLETWWCFLVICYFAMENDPVQIVIFTSFTIKDGGSFQFAMFFSPYIESSHPNWLIFFRGVETTNQIFSDKSLFITLHSAVYLYVYLCLHLSIYCIYLSIYLSLFYLASWPASHEYRISVRNVSIPIWSYMYTHTITCKTPTYVYIYIYIYTPQ